MKTSHDLGLIVKNNLKLVLALVALICVATIAVWINTVSSDDSLPSNHPEISVTTLDILIGLIPLANVALFVSAVALVMNIIDAYSTTIRSFNKGSRAKVATSAAIQKDDQ
jgi:hypothetical protein